MLLIKKGIEPRELSARRNQGADRYDQLLGSDLEAIRTALIREQRGVCCYCMGRIRWEQNAGMRIEHFQSRVDHPSLHLAWGNLLGACPGNEGAAPNSTHCDVHQGDRALTLNPLHEPSMKRVTYSAVGEVRHDDERHCREMGTSFDAGVLNLNTNLIVRNRIAVLTAYRESLDRLGRGGWKRTQLMKEIEDGTQERVLPEFWGYIRWWLEKQVVKHSPR